MSNGWIGVDLDGTLAEYHGWDGLIGKPIPSMIKRVKNYLAQGQDVRIFTARVSGWFGDTDAEYDNAEDQAYLIENWCEEHIGQILPITCIKDRGLIEFWDDRAIQVIPNTGKRADGRS
jgi:hypothetical protein